MGLLAQEVSADKVQKPKQRPPAAEEQIPPEEDENFAKKEYTFNPLQAATELRIGNYYFKKGNFRAAAQRFTEATKWDEGLAEAYLRLGEAKEKQKDPKAAREAYAKYLEIAADAKNAPEVKKRMDKLKH
jgi:tetratricopeptide (TPR) repeat protein